MSDDERARAVLVEDPNPTAPAISTDAHEELFRVLLDTAQDCPLQVLGDILELLSTVVARRLHDELEEEDLD